MSRRLRKKQFLQQKLIIEREMFYLTTHSTHFIYSYMASGIWLRTILIVRKESRCRHIGYSYRLTARVLLYAPSHRQDNTYHGLCYTSRGALAGTKNSSMGQIKKKKKKKKTNNNTTNNKQYIDVLHLNHVFGCFVFYWKMSSNKNGANVEMVNL